MTDEQKTEVEKVVAQELESHGGDPQATLAATIDGRSLEAIARSPVPDGCARGQAEPAAAGTRAATSCWDSVAGRGGELASGTR